MTAPLCFLDTETDGVGPDRKVWEIAIVRREPDGEETAWQAFVDIDLGETPDTFGLNIGRFYERHPFGYYLATGEDAHLDRQLGPAQAATKVAQLTHGAHIVGAVPNFDTEVLGRLLRDNGLIPNWHYHLTDVSTLALGYLAGQGKLFPPPYKSDDLVEALGLPPIPEQDRHTAMGDVAYLVKPIYDLVMGGGK